MSVARAEKTNEGQLSAKKKHNLAFEKKQKTDNTSNKQVKNMRYCEAEAKKPYCKLELQLIKLHGQRQLRPQMDQEQQRLALENRLRSKLQREGHYKNM